VNKVDGPFSNGFLSHELANSHHIMRRGIVMADNPLFRQDFGFSFEQILVTLSALSNKI
jgi:hypothetical protein